MTTSHGHHHHHAKFRWTENLTCRFIQLRKEHGKMFTGRKYSAQAGWEYILRQMREEFPTIMADVHYRVLKKKWSNLLQQYKELKNPVHGDKNKADDISWPFYSAIDEVLGNFTVPSLQYRGNDEEDDEDDLNPQEFLCVSVAPDDADEEPQLGQFNVNYQGLQGDKIPELPRLEPFGHEEKREQVFDVDKIPRITRRSTGTSSRKRSAPTDSSGLLSRLPRATELTIRPIRRGTSICPEVPGLEPINGVRNLEIQEIRGDEEEARSRKCSRTELYESSLERRIVEFFEYMKRRDEENRSILLRMLKAVEDIKNAVG